MSHIDKCWKCGRQSHSCMCFAPSNQKSYTIDEMDLLDGFKKQVEELEKELAQVKHENKVYKELFKEASDYLETNDKTVICNSSLFHQKFRELGE